MIMQAWLLSACFTFLQPVGEFHRSEDDCLLILTTQRTSSSTILSHQMDPNDGIPNIECLYIGPKVF